MRGTHSAPRTHAIARGVANTPNQFNESEMPSKRPLCNKVCVPDAEVMQPSHISQ